RVAWLTRFYFGDGSGRAEGDGLRDLVANLGEIDAREVNSIVIGDGITLRVGKYGPYLEEAGDAAVAGSGPSGAAAGEGQAAGSAGAVDGTAAAPAPRRASVPEDLAPD